MLRKIRVGSIILIACLQMQAARAATDFHIDGGVAWRTLNEFSRQSDLQILFDFAASGETLTHPINGEMDDDEALQALLADTDLTYDYINSYTLAITVRPHGVDSDTLARWLSRFESRFEFQAQSWPEGAGPPLRPLIVEVFGADSDENYIATR